jgi:hypothetical protein
LLEEIQIQLNKSKTEEYDGTSWSASNDLNSDQVYFAGAGSQTAAVTFAGQINPYTRFFKTNRRI